MANFSDCIDYESLFEKSLILHDEVLGPFLAKLKDHLMAIQVSLGRMETWIMETRETIDYLENTFGDKIAMPYSILKRKCECPSGTHDSSAICLHCCRPLSEHKPERTNSNSHLYHSPVSYPCPNVSFMTSGVFTCQEPQVLKEFQNLSVKIEAKYDISRDIDRKKLGKVLELVAMDEM